MVRRAHLHSRTYLFFVFNILVFVSCTDENNPAKSRGSFVPVNVSGIPADIISADNGNLKTINGICYLEGKLFSGFIKTFYPDHHLQSLSSWYLGKQQGISRSFYENGMLRDERSFKENLSYGRQYGLWENGNRKFDFFYINDKSEGLQRQWYPDGKPYTELNYKNDIESGMQKAWRANGKLFANYEVKDGIKYGLQKANLCYTLKAQKIQ